MADLSQFSDADLARMQGIASLQVMPDDQLHALAGPQQPGPGTSLADRLAPKLTAAKDAAAGLSAPGAGAGYVQGLRDPIDAGAQMLVHGLPDSVVSGVNSMAGPLAATPQQVDQGISDNEKAYQDQRAASGGTGFDTTRMVGNMAASLLISRLLPVAKTLMGAPITGAVGGGVYGALNPVTDQNAGNFWDQKLGQMKTGAETGAVMAPLGMAVSRTISPNVDPNVQTLMNKGVTPTPGQILGGPIAKGEDKLTSIPVIGDFIKNAQRRSIEQFNTAALNDALAPIGQKLTGPIGREGIDEVGTKLGAAYDTLLPKLTFQADPQFGSEVNNLIGMAKNLAPQQASQFENILNNKVLNRLAPTGTMDGQTFKGVDSELGRIVKGYLGDPSFDARELGSALGEVQTSLRGALERANPDYSGQLGAINRGWAQFTRLRNAASRLGTDEGVFTPAQLLSAVRAGDQSVGKGAFARGNALSQGLAEAGKSVLGSKYPDSGTPGRYMLAAAAAHLMGATEHIPGAASSLPYALGAGALTSLPYTRPGQWAMAQLLANRPAGAAPLAAAINKGIAPGTAGLTGALLRQPGLPLSLAPNFP